MNKEFLKKSGIIAGIVLISVYVSFLIVPFFLNGIAKSCGNYITTVVKDTTGFVLKFKNLRFVTTPKLTAGVSVDSLNAALPTGETFFTLDNASGKISLLPLLIKRIEVDSVSAGKISLNLNVKKDGKFLLEDYIPEQQSEPQDSSDAPMTELPFGFRLSNHLPDICIKNYQFAFTDMVSNKSYSVQGEKFKISDFILDKKIKLSTNGKVILEDRTPFNYNIKVYNKIMPDVDLNDLVFSPQQQEQTQAQPDFKLNIIDIFKTIYNNRLTADVNADIRTSGTIEDIHLDGYVNIDKISLAVDGQPLPNGHFYMNNKGNSIKLDSNLYTAKDETSSLSGVIKTGKKPSVDMSFKANASINNIFNIIDSLAKSVKINDLDTLSAKGKIDADFNIKADTGKVHSSGYFKVPSASVTYALYNIFIDKITVDADFSNDMFNLKKAGFVVMNQPLNAYGTVKSDTTTDLHLNADKLPIKGLIAAAGQLALLKENNIKSGTLSMNASISGNFKNLKPAVNLNADGINIFNIPSNTTLKLDNCGINLTADGKKYKGLVDVNSVQILNPLANVSVPAAKVTLNEKDVLIDDTYLLLDNSRVDITGKITDYLNNNISMNITAKGNLLASDLRSMIPADIRGYITGTGKIPVYMNVTGNDKVQNIKAQILATPSNYLNIVKVAELNGRNTLINSDIRIVNDSLKLSNTGIYTTTSSQIPTDTLSTPLGLVSGSVDKLSTKQILNNLTLSTPAMVNFEIPGFTGSSVKAKADVTLNGSALSPAFSGSVTVPSVKIPAMKTSLENITVDMGSKSIIINTPSINIDNSVMKAKTIVSTNFNNGVIVKSVDFHSDMLDSDTLIKAMEGMPAQPAGSSASASVSNSAEGNLGVVVQSGKGTINKFKSGGIIAENLSSDFIVQNNTLYLKGLKGNAFSGKVNGNVAVNLLNGSTNVDFHGTGMNAESAIAGAAGLKNALSGILGFNAKVSLNGYAPNEAAMMKSLKGNVDFNIQDGTLGNIGRLENLLYAENVISNGILSAALSPVVNMPVVKSTANFKSITGDMSFNNGWAELKSIKSAGPSMSAFICGRYNLVNATANVTILGRLGAEVVKVLGPVGDLSVDKLTSFIPKFGAATAKILNAMTTNPNGERTAEIPALSNGNNNYKDFKVSFNGGVESKSSVKSFKWLSVCDTSQIEGGSFKDQLQQSSEAINQLRQQKKEDIKKSVDTVKETAKQTSEDIKNQIQNTKDSINELKNLFKKPSSTVPAQ